MTSLYKNILGSSILFVESFLKKLFGRAPAGIRDGLGALPNMS
jgi:hypothetical protein